MTALPPRPRPCDSCPYRQDVPSGVWGASQYDHLPQYDEPTHDQPPRLFLCHQTDANDEQKHVCSGWAGCHDMEESLGVRVRLAQGDITPETAEAILDYVSPVPLFASGAEAAAHGRSSIEEPGWEAAAAIRKITRVRSNLKWE